MKKKQSEHPRNESKETTLKKRVFLEKYRECGTRLMACRAIGISRTTAYFWEKHDPKFEEDMRTAETELFEKLENTALDRAMGGSDQVLMFMLKALNRDKYGERIRHEFTTKTLDAVVDEVTRAIRANVPEFCPHCHTGLDIAPAIARELVDMSSRLIGPIKTEAIQ